MEDLIKALQIFLKYDNDLHSIIVDINPALVSIKDKAELDKLGFNADEDEEWFEHS